ncbi:MAG TPA: OmpA family protein [Pyrinomonadaceae bacterium]|jgi:outer membrane protein OmpA-like peptidoglycan-associated protein|nr:OmpA family protein [Pyrinomonadaceae bacterium]
MSGRDDDSGPDFDLTTPNLPTHDQRRQRTPPQPPRDRDFERTSLNLPSARDDARRPPNPPARSQGHNFDLTRVNFTVPDEDDEDDAPYRRTPAPQPYAQAQPQFHAQPTDAPARRVPQWFWLAGGGFVAALLLLVIVAGLYFFWPFSSSFTLKILNAPSGSKVFVDDVPVGVSQADGAIITQGLRAGEAREVRVSHQGFADWRTTVKSEGGEVREIRVRLTPLTEQPPQPAAADQITQDLEEMGRARIYGINFDPDSDRLKDDSKPTLDRIVETLKKRPAWKLTVEGHTDSTSSAEHNRDLSERRAAAVKSYLQASGIEPTRLTTAGYGASRPVAGNETPAGRAMNRRVELIKQ